MPAGFVLYPLMQPPLALYAIPANDVTIAGTLGAFTSAGSVFVAQSPIMVVDGTMGAFTAQAEVEVASPIEMTITGTMGAFTLAAEVQHGADPPTAFLLLTSLDELAPDAFLLLSDPATEEPTDPGRLGLSDVST